MDKTKIVDKPRAVGKVFPGLKIVVIDDEEILTTMTYKSNRNWTLPNLQAQLISNQNGVNQGILEPNKTMYLTYELSNTKNENTEPPNGLLPTLANQKFVKITNSTSINQNIAFTLENTGELTYLNNPNVTTGTTLGQGFYANTFKIIYQIMDNEIDRPLPENWKSIDFSDNVIDTDFISANMLEIQNYITNNFIITGDTSAVPYFISETHNLLTDASLIAEPQVGDEKVFYGNITTSIAADVYKTSFDLRINPNEFKYTTNPTATNIQQRFFDEVGIYDNDGNLVLISKMSEPIHLSGNIVLLEPTIDF